MIKKLKSKLILIIGATMLLVPVAVPAMVSAQASPLTTQIQAGIGSGTNAGAGGGGCDSTTASSTFNHKVTVVINIFSIIVGAVSVIMIIVGGFRYITSGGNNSGVAGAKNTIIYALIGLVIVALAQVIVHFVLAKVTGAANA